jgi:hypothetical protein
MCRAAFLTEATTWRVALRTILVAFPLIDLRVFLAMSFSSPHLLSQPCSECAPVWIRDELPTLECN